MEREDANNAAFNGKVCSLLLLKECQVPVKDGGHEQSTLHQRPLPLSWVGDGGLGRGRGGANKGTVRKRKISVLRLKQRASRFACCTCPSMHPAFSRNTTINCRAVGSTDNKTKCVCVCVCVSIDNLHVLSMGCKSGKGGGVRGVAYSWGSPSAP